MPGTFNCPSCGAPLDDPGSGDIVRCPYCANSVIVPEALRSKAPSPVSEVAGLSDEQVAEIKQLMGQGLKIQAIKLYRQITLAGLKDAKDAVEAIAAGRPVPAPEPSRMAANSPATKTVTRFVAGSPTGDQKSSRLPAILIGLFFFAIAAIFPVIFFPLGAMAWAAQEYTSAIVSFVAAVFWAVVWGGIGVMIAKAGF